MTKDETRSEAWDAYAGQSIEFTVSGAFDAGFNAGYEARDAVTCEWTVTDAHAYGTVYRASCKPDTDLQDVEFDDGDEPATVFPKFCPNCGGLIKHSGEEKRRMMGKLKPIQLTNDEADLRLMIVESEFDFTSIFEEIQCDGGVYTDISNEGADHLARLFSGMFEQLSEAKDAELARVECVWTPVSERLPETSEWFLVTVNDEINHDGHLVEHMFFQDCIGQWACNEEITKVLAWMPLPEPYQPDSGEERNDD